MLDSTFLAVALLGIGGLVVGILRLAIAALRRSWRAGPLDMFLLAGWAGAAAWFGISHLFWLPAAGLALVSVSQLAWSAKLLRSACSAILGLLMHSGFHALVMAGLGLGLVFWLLDASDTQRTTDEWLAGIENFAAPPTPGDTPAFIAYTDRQRHIPLFACNNTAANQQTHLEEQEKRLMSSWFDPPRILHMGPVDAASNCHGWTFTGGRYILRGMDVPVILEDNGYQRVGVPQSNDVIVYTLAGGAVVHTGIVHSRRADGFVLVESKWGKAGRYLHPPKDQPYSETYTIYRSSRPGNLLAGLGDQELAE